MNCLVRDINVSLCGCVEYRPYKLYDACKPGDHIAVWSAASQTWRHAIFLGPEVPHLGHDNDYVIESLPTGVTKTLFENFLMMKETDLAVKIHYTNAYDLSMSLMRAQNASYSSNQEVYESDTFAVFCRVGKSGKTVDDLRNLLNMLDKRCPPYKKSKKYSQNIL